MLVFVATGCSIPDAVSVESTELLGLSFAGVPVALSVSATEVWAIASAGAMPGFAAG
jgi:hypothetical protein